MPKYMTEQRKKLLTFLQNNPDKQFSAAQIADNLQSEHISLSAVYRNLAALEEENIISRSVKDGCREIFYQYTDVAQCRNCIHLTCTKCGQVFHMDDTAAQQMTDTLLKKEGFEVNKTKTVLYGLCKDCD